MHFVLKRTPHGFTRSKVPGILVLDDLIVFIGIGSGVFRLDLRTVAALGNVLAEVFDRSGRGTDFDIDMCIILMAEIWVVWDHISIVYQVVIVLDQVLVRVVWPFIKRIPITVNACFSIERLRVTTLASTRLHAEVRSARAMNHA